MSFPLSVNVVWTGFLEGFDIYAGDEFLVFVEPSQLPYTIAEFPVPMPGENAEIRVCANENPDCCVTEEFAAPNCSGDTCRIYGITADVGSCSSDTAFTVAVNYVAEGFSGTIDIWANGVFLGAFPQLHPIVLNSVPETAGNVELVMCQTANPECCGSVVFEGKVCGSCMITDLIVTTECDTSGQFTAFVDFNFDNVGTGFTVAGNGTQYGVFTYNALPIPLGPLNGDGTTQWEFLVQDLQNPGCLDFFDLGTIDCSTGLFDTDDRIHALDIMYSNAGAFFVIPEHVSEMSLWTYDGKLIAADANLAAGETVRLRDYIRTPGLYLIRVTAPDRMYVGKVVGME
jgi:hypothetical protein